jgi:hypothetical protein
MAVPTGTLATRDGGCRHVPRKFRRSALPGQGPIPPHWLFARGFACLDPGFSLVPRRPVQARMDRSARRRCSMCSCGGLLNGSAAPRAGQRFADAGRRAIECSGRASPNDPIDSGLRSIAGRSRPLAVNATSWGVITQDRPGHQQPIAFSEMQLRLRSHTSISALILRRRVPQPEQAERLCRTCNSARTAEFAT